MKSSMNQRFCSLAAFLCIFLGCTSQCFAGDLEPSAPPAPTMKTLDQVEARIPMPGSSTPTTPFYIYDSGSYYLTGNRYASGIGIYVLADDVTIDLNGYALIGNDTGTSFGIYMEGRSNIEVKNGTVRDFPHGGLYNYNFNGKYNRAINLRVFDIGSVGIRLFGNGNVVKNCQTYQNGDDGIFIGNGSVVEGCVSRDNGDNGVHVNGVNCIVKDNTVAENDGIGISGGSNSIITGNNVYNNHEDGIYAGWCSNVSGNVVYSNNLDDNSAKAGIRTGGSAVVRNNTLKNNNGANIYVSSGDNVIEGNLVSSSNGAGIHFYSTGNFYMNNRASGNATNYSGYIPSSAGDGGGNVSF